MNIKELENRIICLEKTIKDLQLRVATLQNKKGHWWHEGAGRFANDPVFDEIVRLGREYRESLRPKKKKVRAKKLKNVNP